METQILARRKSGTPPKARQLLQSVSRLYFALADPEALIFRLAARLNLKPILKLAVRRPRTFNQHVRWRMVHDRNPLYVKLVDKLGAKDYVEERVGPGYTPTTYAVVSRSSELNPALLPREYAIKVNHASGGVILVSDTFPSGSALPAPGTRFEQFHLHPVDVDFDRIGKVLDEWLTVKYGGRKSEWAYSQVTPRIYVEEYLANGTPYPPPDLKFFVFGGRCVAVRLDQYGEIGKSRYHFDGMGRFIPVRIAEFAKPLLPMELPAPSLPESFVEMRELAENIGAGLDFVRVDMFEVLGRIVIGELTLYPTAGAARFVPRSYDRMLGEAWPRK